MILELFVTVELEDGMGHKKLDKGGEVKTGTKASELQKLYRKVENFLKEK